MIESGFVAICKILSISLGGFGVSNGDFPLKIALSTLAASSVCPTSSYGQRFVTILPPISSRYRLHAIPPRPPLVKYSTGHLPI